MEWVIYQVEGHESSKSSDQGGITCQNLKIMFHVILTQVAIGITPSTISRSEVKALVIEMVI
jgi:hypothetical protein